MTGGVYDLGVPDNAADLARQERAYAALADSVRGLVDACIRTRVPVEEAEAVAAQTAALTQRLLAEAQEGPLGLEVSSDGRLRDHGNPAVGSRNPIAPPLHISRGDGPSCRTDFEMGAGYEGPPGHVHGGMIAVVLDQVMGMTAAYTGKPGMTAYLNLTYRRPTPLGQLGARAWIAGQEDFKTTVRGEMLDADGQVTVEAEGLFVVPRWAREHVGTPTGDAAEFETLPQRDGQA
ncbi:MAG: PaaI family thioesterase [Micrococcales bacterium]|nr:PaaI family thioesterase [Micrococcales bacterium]